jgi:hypothetical protein
VKYKFKVVTIDLRLPNCICGSPQSSDDEIDGWFRWIRSPDEESNNQGQIHSSSVDEERNSTNFLDNITANKATDSICYSITNEYESNVLHTPRAGDISLLDIYL